MPFSASKTVNVAWWAVYCYIGLWVQARFPGVDALIPGLILSLQEERPKQTAWLLAVFILIQEGTSSLIFGSAVLWYCGLLILFALGRLFFVSGSLFFMVILAAAMCILHSVLLYVLGSLQDLILLPYQLGEQAVTQALLIPLLYAAASLARKRFLNYEYGI